MGMLLGITLYLDIQHLADLEYTSDPRFSCISISSTKEVDASPKRITVTTQYAIYRLTNAFV